MNKILLFTFSLFLVYSCNKDNESCPSNSTLVAPTSYQLEHIGGIVANSDLYDIQLIDENIGFALGVNQDGVKSLFKTEDGGAHWHIKELPENNYLNLVFFNENLGFISLQSDYVSILRTEDGGETWQELSSFAISGNYFSMIKGPNNQLYGVVSPPSEPNKVITSDDLGQTWEIINSLTLSYVSEIKISQDRIYVFENNETCKVMDLMGNNIKEINIDIPTYAVLVIDSNNIIITDQHRSKKTIDGGLHWTLFHGADSKIIHFKDADNGIMIKEDNSCDGSEIFVMSSTSNGGASWQKSEPIVDFDIYDFEVAIITDNKYLLHYKNEFYLLQK